jgi:glycosyltransferase involved in cell wall biosynthesis
VDGTCLGVGRGYGRFLRELLPHLVASDPASEYVVFVDQRTEVALPDVPIRWLRPETSRSQASAAGDRSRRGLGDLWAMRRSILAEELAAMFFPTVFSYVPLPARLPQVVALHDTIAERYGKVVFSRARDRWLWRLKVRLATRRARCLLTVSEWSRRSLVQELGVPADQIHVSPEAPAAIFRPPDDPSRTGRVLASLGLDARLPYFLFVGGRNPHKNLPRTLAAFARITPAHPEARFVLVGDDAADSFHAEGRIVEQVIRGRGLEDRVLSVGFVPDDTLRHLYAGALAVVLVSLEEGFGLPAIEGAACGTPCVATVRSPLPEILAGGGLFVTPEDEEQIAAAYLRLLSHPEERRAMAERAHRAAIALSWDAAANATRNALHGAAGSSG